MAPATVLISGLGIAGPALAYWLARRGHRPILVERTDGLRTGGHAVDTRGTALEVVERMGPDAAVRDARTHRMTLSPVRRDGRRTYDVALRPMHDMRGDREIEIMRDDLVRILYTAVADDVEVRFGDFTVDNLLGLTDQAVLYNEPGRGAAMFTVRGNRRAKALLLFRSEPLGIGIRDQAAQQVLLRERFAGMGWRTGRLVAAMPDAYDFYFDEMSQIQLPGWSAGRVALLGDGSALSLWERGFRANVEQNQRFATDGMATLLPEQ